jgi:hypothetical protein
VLPVWRDLVTHFRQWETQQTDEGLKADQVVKLLKARQKKSVHHAALLAYALDPLFFKQADSNQWMTTAAELNLDEQKRAKALLLRLSSTRNADDEAAVNREWSRFKMALLSADLSEDY